MDTTATFQVRLLQYAHYAVCLVLGVSRKWFLASAKAKQTPELSFVRSTPIDDVGSAIQ